MLQYALLKLLEALGGAGAGHVVEEVKTHRGWLLTILWCATVGRNRRVRVSLAQVLQLRRDQDYVLVRSMKRQDQFGPIGGVIRMFPTGLHEVMAKFGYEPEQQQQGNERLDLRGFVLGKKLPAFLRWFETEQGRELSALTREIHEELEEIALPNIAKLVQRVEVKPIRRVSEGPYKHPSEPYWQFRLLHVLRLDEEQKETAALQSAILTAVDQTEELRAFSVEELRKCRSDGDGVRLADSTGYLYGTSRSGAEPPAY